MSEDIFGKILGGAGGKALSFKDNKGVIVRGELVAAPTERDQIDPATEKVKTFDDGTPRKVIVFTLQTDLRDPDNPEDDGLRTLWAKWEQTKAIGKAMREAKVKTMEVGGTLEIAWTGEVPPVRAGLHPTKTFQARWTPPAPKAVQTVFAAGETDVFASTPTPAGPAQTTMGMLKNMQVSQHTQDSTPPF